MVDLVRPVQLIVTKIFVPLDVTNNPYQALVFELRKILHKGDRSLLITGLGYHTANHSPHFTWLFVDQAPLDLALPSGQSTPCRDIRYLPC